VQAVKVKRASTNSFEARLAMVKKEMKAPRRAKSVRVADAKLARTKRMNTLAPG
jgi:hypothetical protein